MCCTLSFIKIGIILINLSLYLPQACRWAHFTSILNHDHNSVNIWVREKIQMVSEKSELFSFSFCSWNYKLGHLACRSRTQQRDEKFLAFPLRRITTIVIKIFCNAFFFGVWGYLFKHKLHLCFSSEWKLSEKCILFVK